MYTTLKLILISLRPHQWVKNLFVFAALVFSLNLFSWWYLRLSVSAFVVFCLLSGGAYIVNDYFDLEEDRKNPNKSRRPMASGSLLPRYALLAAAVVTATGLLLSISVSREFQYLVWAYLALQILYSISLREILFVDILAIAVGFVLRAWAGAAAIGVLLSPWLLICTFFLALTLICGKRFFEPRQYRKEFIERLMWLSAAAALITYTIYSVVAPVGDGRLVFSVVLVVYGVFRYLHLVYYKKSSRSPTEELLKDRPLMVGVSLWAGLVVLLVYM